MELLQQSMSALEVVGGIILLLACVGIIVLVSMQEAPKQGGLSALTGSGDSFYSQNQGRTKNALLTNATKWLAVTFFVVTIVLYTIISRRA